MSIYAWLHYGLSGVTGAQVLVAAQYWCCFASIGRCYLRPVQCEAPIFTTSIATRTSLYGYAPTLKIVALYISIFFVCLTVVFVWIFYLHGCLLEIDACSCIYTAVALQSDRCDFAVEIQKLLVIVVPVGAEHFLAGEKSLTKLQCVKPASKYKL